MKPFLIATGLALLTAFGYAMTACGPKAGTATTNPAPAPEPEPVPAAEEAALLAAVAEQAVRAPISGFVTKIGFAYAGDSSLRFVEITNPAIGYVARAFYVEPTVKVPEPYDPLTDPASATSWALA